MTVPPDGAVLHPDLACAIALSIVDNPHVTASLDALVVTDPRLGSSRTQTGWLNGTDPLLITTREYLTARRDAMLASPRGAPSAWAASSAVKTRETANARAIQARARALRLLQDRGVLHLARRSGMTVREPFISA